jgi:hypothetical protein
LSVMLLMMFFVYLVCVLFVMSVMVMIFVDFLDLLVAFEVMFMLLVMAEVAVCPMTIVALGMRSVGMLSLIVTMMALRMRSGDMLSLFRFGIRLSLLGLCFNGFWGVRWLCVMEFVMVVVEDFGIMRNFVLELVQIDVEFSRISLAILFSKFHEVMRLWVDQLIILSSVLWFQTIRRVVRMHYSCVKHFIAS